MCPCEYPINTDRIRAAVAARRTSHHAHTRMHSAKAPFGPIGVAAVAVCEFALGRSVGRSAVRDRKSAHTLCHDQIIRFT